MMSLRNLGLALAAAVLVAGVSLTNVLAAGPVKVVAFGDSLMAGYGLPPLESLPARLEAELKSAGRAVVIENAGVSGDTTAAGTERLDWAIAAAPEIVILALGANDALRGISPKETERNLAEMVKRLKAKGSLVLLAGMQAPPNLGPDYAAEFNPIFARLAEAEKIALYPFLLDGVAAVPALNQADGIHPNAEGTALIARRLTPFLLPLIDEAAAGKS